MKQETQAIFDVVTQILPKGVVLAVEEIHGYADGLHAGLPAELHTEKLHQAEQVLIENAIEKRRAEFTAGRVAARRALSQLGHHNFTLLSGNKREPLMPQGITGSITHHGNYALAVVAEQKMVEFIGVDLAGNVPLKPQLIKKICTEKDKNCIEKFAFNDFPCDPFKSVFCIKEAVYKCLYPLVKQVFGFHDVTVNLTPQSLEVALAREVEIKLVNQNLFSQKLFSQHLFSQPLFSQRDIRIIARVAAVKNHIVSVAWIAATE